MILKDPYYTQQWIIRHFSSVLWHCWLGNRKGIPPVKSWVMVCWSQHFYWSFAHIIAPVGATISITLSSNKIQNGDILVPANAGPPRKLPLKWRVIVQQHQKWTHVPAGWTNLRCFHRISETAICCYVPAVPAQTVSYISEYTGWKDNRILETKRQPACIISLELT